MRPLEGVFVSRRMFVPRKAVGGGGTASLHSPVGMHEIELCWTGGSYSPSGVPTDGRNKQLASAAVWLCCASATPRAETNRVAALHRLRSLVTAVGRINNTETSDSTKAHLPAFAYKRDEWAGSLDWTRLGMTYVVLLQYAFMRGLWNRKKKRYITYVEEEEQEQEEQEQEEEKHNRKEPPSLSRNSIPHGDLQISLFLLFASLD